MRLLLDTHVLLWALASPSRLGRDLRDEIERSEVFFSAASIWEIAIKSALGKLDFAPGIIADAALEAGLRPLAISPQHAARVADLPSIHRDPFDRVLVAQALIEPLHLVTADSRLGRYSGLVRVVEIAGAKRRVKRR